MPRALHALHPDGCGRPPLVSGTPGQKGRAPQRGSWTDRRAGAHTRTHLLPDTPVQHWIPTPEVRPRADGEAPGRRPPEARLWPFNCGARARGRPRRGFLSRCSNLGPVNASSRPQVECPLWSPSSKQGPPEWEAGSDSRPCSETPPGPGAQHADMPGPEDQQLSYRPEATGPPAAHGHSGRTLAPRPGIQSLARLNVVFLLFLLLASRAFECCPEPATVTREGGAALLPPQPSQPCCLPPTPQGRWGPLG